MWYGKWSQIYPVLVRHPSINLYMVPIIKHMSAGLAKPHLLFFHSLDIAKATVVIHVVSIIGVFSEHLSLLYQQRVGGARAGVCV